MRYWPQKPPLGVPINWGDPLARGLVGCWLMNEGSGNQVYDLGGRNTGTFGGNAVWFPGKYGSAIKFDGASGYIDCGLPNNSAMLNGLPMTIAAWIYPITRGEGNAGRIVTRALTSQGPNFCISGAAGAPGLYFAAAGGTTLIRASSDGTLSFSIWQHVVLSWDGSTTAANCRFYINGKEVSYKTTTDGALPWTTNAARTIRIGNRSDDAGTFDGLIDNVRIYNRALTATEVQQLYMTPFRIFQESF